MTMGRIWTGMVFLSVVCGLWAGRGAEVAAAAIEGANTGVELCISMAGMLCLWMGVMEVMKRSGLADKVSKLLGPFLGWLYPGFKGNSDVMNAIAANMSANLLGLGNAATPLGMDAAQKMNRSHSRQSADALCMLVVCNTASIQLIPTTVAALRSAAGAETPFDILPAVWVASLVSVTVGISLAKLCAKVWRD